MAALWNEWMPYVNQVLGLVFEALTVQTEYVEEFQKLIQQQKEATREDATILEKSWTGLKEWFIDGANYLLSILPILP